jgi:hypothetical protein
MNQATIDALGIAAAEQMMRGAAELIRSRGLSSKAVDLDAIVEEIRRRAPAAIDQALRDARDALEVPGMNAIAEATFAATFRLAGIAAARAVIEVRS